LLSPVFCLAADSDRTIKQAKDFRGAMLVGRDHRKRVSQGLAFAIYRYVALWFLVYACVTYGEVGQAVALGVVALGIMTRSIGTALDWVMRKQLQEGKISSPTSSFMVFFGNG
jgi:hypothetical protein